MHNVMAPGDILTENVLEALALELEELMEYVTASEAELAPLVASVHPENLPSARNLVHYLALRRRDIRDLQERLARAGVEVLEARISHLAYAQGVAAAMLQRQQASAIIAARFKIVEGAVGMVENALDLLAKKNIVQLDDERKATMVSNLLVVLCGEKDAQPIVNAGTLYT